MPGTNFLCTPVLIFFVPGTNLFVPGTNFLCTPVLIFFVPGTNLFVPGTNLFVPGRSGPKVPGRTSCGRNAEPGVSDRLCITG